MRTSSPGVYISALLPRRIKLINRNEPESSGFFENRQRGYIVYHIAWSPRGTPPSGSHTPAVRRELNRGRPHSGSARAVPRPVQCANERAHAQEGFGLMTTHITRKHRNAGRTSADRDRSLVGSLAILNRRIDELRIDSANPRQHSDKQIRQVAASIRWHDP